MPADPAQIVRSHESWLRTVLLSRTDACEGASDVDDLLQEVFLAVVKQQSELPRIERLEPWLYRIAVRTVLQHRRRLGRYRRRLLNYRERVPVASDAHVDPLAWVLADESTSQVRDALHALTATDREVLLLKHAHGWTYQQIADHLGASVSTVEYRLARAKRRLRIMLNQLVSEETVK